jgi:hypothetical protein
MNSFTWRREDEEGVRMRCKFIGVDRNLVREYSCGAVSVNIL